MTCEFCNMNCPPPQTEGFSRKHWTQAALVAYRNRKESSGIAGYSERRVTIWDSETKTWVQI